MTKLLIKEAGIYKIRNNITNDFYIGSAANLRYRWYNHRNALGANRHSNQHLQSAWNKYGADAFEFIVIELCEKGKLLEREQYYIDSESPAYNINKLASSPLGINKPERETRVLPRIKKFRGATLLIEDFPIQLIPRLAVAIGLNEAIFIQQLHYWSRKSKDGWVYNTYEQWQKDNFPFWSVPTIKRIVYSLETKELIISKQPDSFDRRKYYAIDYDLLDTLGGVDYEEMSDGLDQIDALGTDQIEPLRTDQLDPFSLTEITETTTLDSDLQSGKPEPKSKRKSKHPVEAIRPLATALADATSLKYSDNIPMLHKVASRLLDNGYTPEKVAEFSAWWQTEDWRGKKGQPPTPWQVQSMIGILDKQEGNEQDSEKRERFLRQLEQEQK
ncbi:MAG: GIY-YIG nuclease family protein [Candidatus Neomarinimicrobiota bacterium]